MDSWELLRSLGVPLRTASADTDATLSPLFDQVEALLKDLGDQTSKLPIVLVAARVRSEGLPEGRIWQSTVKRLLDDASDLLEQVDTLKYRLEDSDVEDLDKAKAVGSAADALFVPRKATVAYAISDVDFTDDEITYDIAVLKTWASSLADWTKDTKSALTKFRRKAKV